MHQKLAFNSCYNDFSVGLVRDNEPMQGIRVYW